MAPEDIPLGYWTHINFAFAFINPTTFEIAPMSNEVCSSFKTHSSSSLQLCRSRHYTNVSQLWNRSRMAYRSGLVSVAGRSTIQVRHNTPFQTLHVQVLHRLLSSSLWSTFWWPIISMVSISIGMCSSICRHHRLIRVQGVSRSTRSIRTSRRF